MLMHTYYSQTLCRHNLPNVNPLVNGRGYDGQQKDAIVTLVGRSQRFEAT